MTDPKQCPKCMHWWASDQRSPTGGCISCDDPLWHDPDAKELSSLRASLSAAHAEIEGMRGERDALLVRAEADASLVATAHDQFGIMSKQVDQARAERDVAKTVLRVETRLREGAEAARDRAVGNVRTLIAAIDAYRLDETGVHDNSDRLKTLVDALFSIPVRQYDQAALSPTPATGRGSDCTCRACWSERNGGRHAISTVDALVNPIGMPFIVCETCGNKRCPHATNHRHPCTNSNEPGQEGSVYT